MVTYLYVMVAVGVILFVGLPLTILPRRGWAKPASIRGRRFWTATFALVWMISVVPPFIYGLPFLVGWVVAYRSRYRPRPDATVEVVDRRRDN